MNGSYEIKNALSDIFLDSFEPGGNPFDPAAGTASLNADVFKAPDEQNISLLTIPMSEDDFNSILEERRKARKEILDKILRRMRRGR